jgi:CRISPR-associated protein Csb1
LLDLLEVGHRVGDAVLRYTSDSGYQPFRDALAAFVKGDSRPLARLAPTSLVFGHWDSRPGGTKSKARRILRSEVVAYNVARATKRSQYWSSIDPEVNEELGQILAEAKETASHDPETKNPASQLGMTDVPAPESPGGVIAFGKIERTSIIALSGLRALVALDTAASAEKSGETVSEPSAMPDDATLNLRRYLFALALTSVANTGVWDLREGCILVRNGPKPTGDLAEGDAPIALMLVSYTGKEEPFTLPSDVEAYLKAAAEAFFSKEGLPKTASLTFDPAGARAAIIAQRGGDDAEPKSKKELITALVAFPEYSGKEAELNKKKVSDLRELWKTQRDAAGQPSNGSSDPNDGSVST